MAKSVEGYVSNRGTMFKTHREAVVDDVRYLMQTVSQAECELEPLAAAYMVKFPQDFINVLEQMLPQRVSMDHLQREVDHLRSQLRLINSMDQSLGGTMPPGDVLKRVQNVATDALRED